MENETLSKVELEITLALYREKYKVTEEAIALLDKEVTDLNSLRDKITDDIMLAVEEEDVEWYDKLLFSQYFHDAMSEAILAMGDKHKTDAGLYLLLHSAIKEATKYIKMERGTYTRAEMLQKTLLFEPFLSLLCEKCGLDTMSIDEAAKKYHDEFREALKEAEVIIKKGHHQ